MRAAQLLVVILYASYMVYAGLGMLVLPWSDLWALVVIRTPPTLGALLDLPWVRGGISAYGILHLLIVLGDVLVLPATWGRKR